MIPAGERGLAVRLLGELELSRDGRTLALPASKKTRALLGYLVATGRPHLREKLSDLLWDGPDDPRAQLRWSLTKLRPLVDERGTARLVADRERVAFEPAGVRIDLADLRAELAGGVAEARLETLERAAGRFRGDLLDGLDLPGCMRFQAWCTGEREAVRTLRAQILAALAERSDDPEAALRWAREWLALDPLSEPAHALALRRLTELGRTREAQRQYATSRELLERELGLRGTGDLERARSAIGAPRAPAPEEPAGRPPATSAATRAERAMVGRERESGEIGRAMAEAFAASGPRRLLLVAGEPGIGKTRLLEELAARATAAGGRLLRGRSFEAELVRPYGVWIDALRPLALGEIPEPLRGDLAPLKPELGESGPRTDRNRLFAAVAALLGELARAAPLALVLDDLHWMDEASAALLHFLVRSSPEAPLLLAAGARTAELADNPAALRAVRSLSRARRLDEVSLAPLDASATAELVRGIDPSLDAGRVFAESAGNPLFALELASARAGGGDGSASLDRLIEERLGRLGERARAVIPWAAALGRSFGLDLLARACGEKPGELLGAVEELERRGVLRPSPAAGESGYDFAHDLVRAGAYRRISAPRRRLIHSEIARALEHLTAADPALSGDLAHHATLAGDFELAARALLAAGERCIRMFAHAEADAVAMRGVALLEPLPPVRRLPTQLALLRVAVHSTPRPERARVLRAEILRRIEEAEVAQLADAARVGYYLLAMLSYREMDFAGARESTLRSTEAAARTGARTAATARTLAFGARCLLMLDREIDRAQHLIVEAAAIAEQDNSELLELLWSEGLLAHHRGDLDGAVARLSRAPQLIADAELLGHAWGLTTLLHELAGIEIERRRFAAAIEWVDKARPLVAKIGEGAEAPFGDALDALARYGEGTLADGAMERALQALRDADAKAHLAYALDLAAELDLRAGRLELARRRATEALAAAEAVERGSEQAIAGCLIARIALAAGDPAAARGAWEAAGRLAAPPTQLSARALAEVASLERTLVRS